MPDVKEEKTEYEDLSQLFIYLQIARIVKTKSSSSY